MSAIVMQVEFLAGTRIFDAVSEAKVKAITFDLAYVEFKFNGVRMLISQNADTDKAVDEFNRCMSGKHDHDIVVF